MPAKKTKKRKKKLSPTMSAAEIKRAQRMYKNLELKLHKISEELTQMMDHIPHCP
jgi:hypothetical protein